MAKTFSNLMGTLNIQIQELQRNTIQIEYSNIWTEYTQNYTVVNHSTVTENQGWRKKLLKLPEEKRKQRISTNILSWKQAMRQWNTSVKVMKEKNCQLKILCPGKIFFKRKDKILRQRL